MPKKQHYDYYMELENFHLASSVFRKLLSEVSESLGLLCSVHSITLLLCGFF